MKKIYFVPNRCVGCEECVVACEKVHDWESRNFVEMADGYFPFPMRCNHCEDAPCKAICPTEAIFRTEMGAVVVNTEKCIGCGSCVMVCPFGILRLSDHTGKVVKCDMCTDKIEKGEEPICVAQCPKDAIMFGEIDEPLVNRRKSMAKQVKTALFGK